MPENLVPLWAMSYRVITFFSENFLTILKKCYNIDRVINFEWEFFSLKEGGKYFMKYIAILLMLFLCIVPAIASEKIHMAVIDFSYEKDDSISRGFSVTLEEKLRKLENMSIIPGESQKQVFEELAITRPKPSMKETIGKALCADFLTDISLNEKNDEITIIIQLFDVKKNTVVLEETFTGKEENIFNIEGDIAIKIADYFKYPIPGKKDLYLMPAKISSFKSFCEGLNLYEESSIDEAYSFFLKSVNEDTHFIDAYKYLEYTARKSGKVDDSIKNYENLLEIEADNPVLINYLGNAYYYKKNLSEAENLYKKAIEIDSLFPNPHTNLGTIYAINKKYDEALKEYDEALKYSDRKAQIYYNTALIYNNKGDKNKAKIYFKKALDLEPRNPDFSPGRYYIYDMKVIVTA